MAVLKNKTKTNLKSIIHTCTLGKQTKKSKSKLKAYFLEKINKVDTFLAKLNNKKERTQIINMRNERGNITTDSMGI